MPRYKINTEWKRPDGTTWTESTGLVLGADTSEQALAMATRRGTASGCGSRPSYVGLVAIEVAS